MLAARSMTLLVLISACSTPSSIASQVCAELTATGVARECRAEDERSAVSVRFTLTGPGSHGYVYVYDSSDAYRRALDTDAEIDALFKEHSQGPHRYRHQGKRVSIMLVHSADEEAQAAAQRVIDQL